MHTQYETIDELLAAAEQALEKGARRNADRILLFNQVTQALKVYVHRDRATALARRDLRISLHNFMLTVREARGALDDWNLGIEITRRLGVSLRDCIVALDKLREANIDVIPTP